MAVKLLAIRVVQGDCEGVYPRMYIRVVTSGGGGGGGGGAFQKH